MPGVQRSGFLHLGRGGVHQLLQLAVGVEFQGDVAPAHQLAVDVDLGEGRPVGVAGEVLEDLRVLQDIDVREGNPALLQGGGGAHGEAALGELGGALHVDDHGVALDLLIDTLQNVQIAPHR